MYVVFWLLLVELSCGIVWGIHRGLYSLFTKEVLLVTSFTQIGLVVSVFGLTKAVTNLSLGALSDKIGRKPTIILGMIMSGLGGLMIALASVYDDMLIGTALFGLGQGSSFVGIMVSMNEVVASARRGLSMGLFELAAYGGSSIGSALGGYVAFTHGLRLPFYGIMILSIAGIVVAVVTIPETKVTKKTIEKSSTTAVRGKYSATLRHLIPLYIAGFSSKIMDSPVWSFLPLYLSGFKMNITEITTVTSAFTFSWAFSQPLTGFVSDKVGRKKVIIIGLTGTAITILLYLFTSNFMLLSFFAFLMGLGAALFYTPLIAMVGDIAPLGLEGTLIGSYRFFRDMGYSAGPVLLGMVADALGLQYAFYVPAIILLATAVIVYAGSKETRILSH